MGESTHPIAPGKPSTGSNLTPAEEEYRIHRELDNTRLELTETIKALQNRVSIDNLKHQARETANEAIDGVKDATVRRAERMAGDINMTAREAGSGILGMMRKNPIPAGLALFTSHGCTR